MREGGRRLRGKQSIAVPWTSTDHWLAARSLERIPVPADGNFQFHALSLHTNLDHVQLRSQILDFLSLHSHVFADFLVEDSVPAYLHRMAQPAEWGDHITLMAAARLLNRDIHVVSASGVTVIESHQDQSSPLWLAYNSVHYDAVFPRCVEPVLVGALKPSEDIVSCSVDSSPGPSISVSKAVDIGASLAVASCNVTSLRKNYALLDFADIIGIIQESRHTATGLSALASKLRTIGYSVIFGHPVSAQVTKKKKVSRTLFNGQQGGVALAFKHHLSAQIAPLGCSERRLRLWESKRWLHVLVPYGSGRRAIHVMVFYGYSGQYSNNTQFELNETLLQDVFAEANLYRDLPCILLSDLNCEPQHSETCRQACLRDGWLDTAVAASGTNALSSAWLASSFGYHLFLDKTAVTFQQYSALEDCGFPNHVPVKIQLSLPALRTLYNQPVKPKDFSNDQLRSLPSAQEESLFLTCFADSASQSDSAILTNDATRLWHLWNSVAEDFLCKRAEIAQPAKYSGRGRFPKFVLQPSSGVSRPVRHGGAQTTVRERMLRKLTRQIGFYLSQLSQNLGPNSFHLVRLRKKILHRCCLLHIPCVDSQFLNIRDNAIAEADNLSNKADASALLRWRNKIKVDFRARKRETYKWLTREYSCPQTFLKKDSTFTADSIEIDTLVRSIWQPIMNRSSSEPVPSWDVFYNSFSARLPTVSY